MNVYININSETSNTEKEVHQKESPQKEENNLLLRLKMEELRGGVFYNSDVAFIWKVTALKNKNKFTLTRTIINKTDYLKWLSNHNISNLHYKVELCNCYFNNPNGCLHPECDFAHNLNELQELVRHKKYKSEICQSFTRYKYCRYGNRCHFIHDINYYDIIKKEFTTEEYVRLFF